MHEIIKDENGKISSTRTTLILTLILFLVAGFSDIYAEVDINNSIYEIIKIIMGLGLTSTAARGTVKNWNNTNKDN